MPDTGNVVAIYLAPTAGGRMVSVDAARAVYGQGLKGDRYATAEGTFSRPGAAGREVTLIETEALEALEREYDVALGLGDSRRNVVTRGVALNHLVGRVFTIGEVTLWGVRLCEPCASLLEPSKYVGHKEGIDTI